MNKLSLFLLCLLLTLFMAPIWSSCNRVEVRVAAFVPQSERFRDLYGTVSPCYEIEASTRLCCWELWANFDWFSECSNESGCRCKSSVQIPNGSFGLKYFTCLCSNLDIYLGIGPSFGGIFLHNHSCCGNERVSDWAIGGVAKSGLRWYSRGCVFVDIFVDYLYQTVCFCNDRRVNIGGLKAGGGVGLRF